MGFVQYFAVSVPWNYGAASILAKPPIIVLPWAEWAFAPPRRERGVLLNSLKEQKKGAENPFSESWRFP